MDAGGARAWAEEEFGGAWLSDIRNVRRAVALAADLAQRPAPTIPRVCRTPAAIEGAYDFLELPRDVADPDDLADAAHRACAARCAAHDLVLVAIDGSSWTFTDPACRKGFGPIGPRAHKARGLKVMTAYAMTADGTPLGTLAQARWVRSDAPDPTPHARRAAEAKESRWWVALQARAVANAGAAARARPPPRLWFQLDREADQVPVLWRAVTTPDAYVTVRVDHDRLLAASLVAGPADAEAKLCDAVAAAPVVGGGGVRVAARGGRPARIARVTVAVVHVTARLRAQWTKRVVGDAPLTVVAVREAANSCPPGEAPVAWLLYTTYPVVTFDDAIAVARAYACRWRIERLHFATKSGAGRLPDSQLGSLTAAERWAIVHTAVAARLQAILYRSRAEPDASADIAFTRDEIDATLVLLEAEGRSLPYACGQTPSLGEMVDAVARLGGYLGPKRSGGPPGIQTFTRGFGDVVPAARLLRALRGPPGASDQTKG